jgi:hypothetical protein
VIRRSSIDGRHGYPAGTCLAAAGTVGAWPAVLGTAGIARRAGDDLNNSARRFIGPFTKVALTAA